MNFFKGLQWFEWLLIGIVVTMLGVSYLLWNKYDERTEQIGGIKVENSVLTETVKYKDQSATISDQVVAEFVQEKEDVKAELEQSREGVIDDYINMATAPTVAFPAPAVDVPKAKVTTRPEATQARPTTEVSNATGDSDRISLLANRMHEHYCKAAPERGVGCNAVGINQ
jgi:hypothetical protein